MATKKQPNGAIKITDEMVSLFRWGLEIKASPDVDLWEEQGGRHREFLDVSSALDVLAGLALWDSPILSDSAERDPVTKPILRALEEAASQDAPGGPLVRLNEVGGVEAEDIRKRIGEAVARLRLG